MFPGGSFSIYQSSLKSKPVLLMKSEKQIIAMAEKRKTNDDESVLSKIKLPKNSTN